MRCLDCPSSETTIELLDSPMISEQKKLVKFLIRKFNLEFVFSEIYFCRNLNDLEIYREITRVYGKHSLIGVEITDNSNKLESSRFLHVYLLLV